MRHPLYVFVSAFNSGFQPPGPGLDVSQIMSIYSTMFIAEGEKTPSSLVTTKVENALMGLMVVLGLSVMVDIKITVDKKVKKMLVHDMIIGSKSLDVELRGGRDESEGVVYVNDRPVCADVVPFSFFWSMENALVTCRMFG